MKYLLLFLFGTSALGADYLTESFEKAALKANVPVTLLRAVCFAESRHQPTAYNYSDAGGTNHAFGLCQVLRTTAFQYVSLDSKCSRDFRWDPVTNKHKIPRTYEECKLFGPYTNAYAAAKLLRVLLTRYDNSWVHAIAAYNAGRVKMCPASGYLRFRIWNPRKQVFQQRQEKCPKGGLLNHGYVDRVLKGLDEGM